MLRSVLRCLPCQEQEADAAHSEAKQSALAGLLCVTLPGQGNSAYSSTTDLLCLTVWPCDRPPACRIASLSVRLSWLSWITM